ncbi:uncharacterized protein LOC129599513 [Paramacrobiotus metropolitanus]|uniref:uncharacterized protein LOC129599513 n=1 Tax=Paramacrobiotus metropolitanus TaxID=2943436 RepID=UPI00244583DE|nr:uncharacterized protein LOC129599513 [Paramacrobiotus metropolitanus]
MCKYSGRMGQQLFYCNGRLYAFPFGGCTYGFNTFPVASPVVASNTLYLCNGAYYTYPFGGCTYNTVQSNIIAGAPVSVLPFSPIVANPAAQTGTPQIAPIGSTSVTPGQIGPLPAGSGTNPSNPTNPTNPSGPINNLPIDTVIRPGSREVVDLLPKIPVLPNGISQIAPLGSTAVTNGQVGPL